MSFAFIDQIFRDTIPSPSVGQVMMSAADGTMVWADRSMLAPLVQQYAVPASVGTTTAVNDKTDVLILDPSGIIVSTTVTLPSSPVDGKTVTICAGGFLITALTVNAAGASIGGVLTALGANAFASYIYRQASNKWFRCG